eukprot:m.278019 g.278019  ORF g.278019 m.278019 type:complete len:101 (+) comp15735_c0_seq6:1685-1987(+)
MLCMVQLKAVLLNVSSFYWILVFKRISKARKPGYGLLLKDFIRSFPRILFMMRPSDFVQPTATRNDSFSCSGIHSCLSSPLSIVIVNCDNICDAFDIYKI